LPESRARLRVWEGGNWMLSLEIVDVAEAAAEGTAVVGEELIIAMQRILCW
jgi:hypothetical protein